MRKNKILLVVLMCLVTLAIVSSCNKDERIKGENDVALKSRSTNLTTVMDNRIRFSKAFSKAIQNGDFYDFMVTECTNSPLNDAEILYANIYNRQIGRLGTTFANYLALTEQSLSTAVSNSSTFYNSLCINTDPLLGIVLMPGRLNDFSTIGTIANSKKVYIDKIFDEFENTESISFSYNGVTSSHLYGEEPNDPYFAIKQNEEYLAYNLVTEEVLYNEPYTLTTIGDYIRYNDVKSIEARIVTIGNIAVADKDFNSDTGDGTLTPRSCTEPCDRDCEDGKDAITRIKFNHDYEGWPRGGPEFIMQYAYGFNTTSNPSSSSPYGYVLSNSSRNNYILKGDEDKWYYKNTKNTSLKSIQLLEWEIPRHSLDMQELWTEDDGQAAEYTLGGSFKVNIPLLGETGVNLGEKKLAGGDDEIATIIVQYCDNWSDNYGYEYTVAGISGDLFIAQLDRDY